MNYIKLLWENRYTGILILLLCACLGSIRGAMKESGEPFIPASNESKSCLHDLDECREGQIPRSSAAGYLTGVTQEDLAGMEQAGKDAPDMIGIIPLASEQNRWRNFSYAVHYAVRGAVCYCLLMAVYLPLYHCRFFSAVRDFWSKDD